MCSSRQLYGPLASATQFDFKVDSMYRSTWENGQQHTKCIEPLEIYWPYQINKSKPNGPIYDNINLWTQGFANIKIHIQHLYIFLYGNCWLSATHRCYPLVTTCLFGFSSNRQWQKLCVWNLCVAQIWFTHNVYCIQIAIAQCRCRFVWEGKNVHQISWALNRLRFEFNEK